MLLEYKHAKLASQNVSESAAPCEVESNTRVDQVRDTKLEQVPVLQQRAVKVNHHA